jgi:hypothetical protein
MRRLPWTALAVVLAGLHPATAPAATLDVVGGDQMRYVAGPGELNFNTLQIWNQMIVVQEGVNFGLIDVKTVSPCSDQSAGPPGSPMYGCPAAGITSVMLDTGDQNDYLSFPGPLRLPVTVHAGDGNDDLFTRNDFQDKIDCGPGTDSVRADKDDIVASDCESVERGSLFGGNGDGGSWTRADGKRVGVSINGGAEFTNDPVVEITALGPDAATETLISNDGGFAAPVSFPAAMDSFPWRLPETGGVRLPKTVYVRFDGGGLDNTRTFSDDIVLDQTAPAVSAARLRGRRLAIRARDSISGVSSMQFRLSNGRATSFHRFARVSRVRGSAPRSVRVRDRARNVSRWRAVSR